MKNINLNKLIRNIIYILTVFLIVLIIYNSILLLNNQFFNKTSYKNSFRVNKTIDNISNDFNINSSYKIKFKENDINKLSSISSADILMLDYDSSNHQFNYSAVFSNNNFIKDSSMEVISYIDEKDFPKINFLNYNDLKNKFNNNYIDTISVVNIDSSFSNFLYYNNEYHYFYNGLQGISICAKFPITYKNIVIDASSQKENTFYVYSNGLFKEFKRNSLLYLTKGKTFWLTLNSDSTLSYNFSNVQNKVDEK
ncbi:hypothetical protein [Clostridium taeniosporum]|uniref:Uncharacterized protein n=1 Tax=Clostridium taeniosporum TaxID=394958 RepID=A0A1D7XGG1_9CLOT|nr:hypothetical protein [Clostridium taeniosporum]AOR22441.1 hypothetical protein BGI42_01270 [Clostridium taeniosporum]